MVGVDHADIKSNHWFYSEDGIGCIPCNDHLLFESFFLFPEKPIGHLIIWFSRFFGSELDASCEMKKFQCQSFSEL